MKLSWGTSIVLAITAFITFILFLVITMTTNKNLDHDLVVEEYYKKELDFQHQMDKEQNARTLAEDIRITRTSEGWVVNFPQALELQHIKGKLSFYRPSNINLDFEVPVSLSSHQLLIPDNRLIKGRWNIEIDWSYHEEHYFFQQQLTY